jgi:hypothetical protein
MAGEFAGGSTGSGFSGGTAGSSFGGIISSGVSFYEYLRNPKKFYITNPFQGFEDLVAEGLPVREKTREAVLRLGGSQNPVVKQLGRDLAVLQGGGVELSSSQPAARAALSEVFARAMSGLEAQGFPKQLAFRELTNVLSSHTATPGIAIPVSPPQMNLFPTGGSNAAAFAAQLRPIPFLPNPFQPGGINLPQGVADIVRPLVPYAEELKALTGHDIFRPQATTTQMIPAPQPQPQPVNYDDIPTVNPQDCPSCQPLRRQQQQLEKEIQTEQGQLQQQRQARQQQQIDQFKQLEQQPVDQRNIPQELQQKQDELNQIAQELEDLQNEAERQQQPRPYQPPPGQQQPTPPSSGGGQIQTVLSPRQPPGTLTASEQQDQEEELFTQGQPTGVQPDPTKAYKFCVACATQFDSVKFLNGEPSACSVIPYPGGN